VEHWNLGPNSAFALGPRKTMESIDRTGRSEEFQMQTDFQPGEPLDMRALTLVLICAVALLKNICKLVL
jgi:hypothetical protein